MIGELNNSDSLLAGSYTDIGGNTDHFDAKRSYSDGFEYYDIDSNDEWARILKTTH